MVFLYNYIIIYYMRLKLIIAGRPDGLGARLLNFLNTKCLANFLNVSHLICWSTTSIDCKCPMEYLINEGTDYISTTSNWPDMKDENLVDYIKTKYDIDLLNSNILYPGKQPIMITKKIIKKYDVLVLSASKIYKYEIGHKYEIDYKYKITRDKMANIFNKLISNEYVQERINIFKQKYFLKYKVIAIHVRRGDCENSDNRAAFKRGNVSLDSFYNILDLGMFNKDKYLYFICSDDQTVIDTINEKYQRPILKNGIPIINSSKTFYYPCRSLDRTDPLAIQDAWIIMNLMKMCSLIICSRSIFNDIPCYVSNAHRCYVDNNVKKTFGRFERIRQIMEL
jgi:hypothetical protein